MSPNASVPQRDWSNLLRRRTPEQQEYQVPARRRLREWFDQSGKWIEELSVFKSRELRHEQWIAERLRFAATVLRESVTIDPDIRGGVPVLKGTRVPIAQIVAEICEDASLSEIAEDLDLDVGLIVKALEGMAIHLDRPFFR